MQGIVEGFEGNFVIIEIEGVTQDIIKADVNSGVKGGDVVVLVNGKWVKDEAETKRRTKEVKDLMSDVWED